MYCAARRLCPNYEEWDQYIKDPSWLKKWKLRAGWRTCGLGFFQLVNFKQDLMIEKTKKQIWYTEKIGNCTRSDRFFLQGWGWNKTRFNWGEFAAIHLGECGENWFGRKTEIFA